MEAHRTPARGSSGDRWLDHGFTVRWATWRHPGKGHDRTLVLDTFAGVADGATPLGPGWPDPGDFAGRALRDLGRFASDPTLTAEQVFAAAIRTTSAPAGSQSPRLPIDRGEDGADLAPGEAHCAVAAAWLDAAPPGDARLHVAVLGDCLALIETTDGTVTVLTDPAVSALDARAARADPYEVPALLRGHRSLANTPGGYWIYGSEPAAAAHLRSTSLTAARVATLLLCTDGLKRAPVVGASARDQRLPSSAAKELPDAAASVGSRRLAGAPIKSTDDEGVVLITARRPDQPLG